MLVLDCELVGSRVDDLRSRDENFGSGMGIRAFDLRFKNYRVWGFGLLIKGLELQGLGIQSSEVWG